MNNSSLDGRVAIVTGGARGIGAAIARALSADGARVAITGGAPTLADRRVAADVERQLSYSKTFDGTCIEVHVHGEDVFLRGRLPSLRAKIEAGLLATTVRGVTRVHNQIRVRQG